MTDYEPLSRSSAFLVPARAGFPYRYHVLTSAHVTHPFKFEDMYPRDKFEFLDFVTEQDTQSRLQWRTESGHVFREFPLAQRSFLHPYLDLVLLHIQHEADVLHKIHAEKLPLYTLTLADKPLAVGEQVAFYGHILARDETGDEVLTPHICQGVVNTLPHWSFLEKLFKLDDPDESERVLAKTEAPLQMGMCGGPVVSADHKCVGVIEGTVRVNPEASPELQKLHDNATFICAETVLEFIDTVEHEVLGAGAETANRTDTEPVGR